MSQGNPNLYQKSVSSESDSPINAMDSLVNSIFALNARTASIRWTFFQLSFLLIWAFTAIIRHQPGDLDFRLLPALDVYPFQFVRVINHLLALFFAWDVLLIMASILTGFFIARQLAAIYLADIFEIKELNIADKFISQAAFSNTTFNAIHIEDGNVRPEDRRSPIFRIGGPGNVQINLENSAVFEKIDGQVTIAGPTVNQALVLEGFERLRKIVDLRDQTTNFHIKGRTRDGIPIEIRDIRLIFSVLRDTSFRTLSRPYPFKTSAIHWLVYNQGPGPWTTSLIGLVRGELANYIAQRNLGEILAAIGEPELQNHLTNQKMVYRKLRKNWSHSRRYKVFRLFFKKMKKGAPGHLPIYFQEKTHPKQKRPSRLFINRSITLPDFNPRHKLSKLFYEDFSNSFRQKAQRRGVRLEWINVGTWHTPADLIPEQHLDAWKISSENQLKLNPKVLEQARSHEKYQTLLKIVQTLPIMKFIQYQNEQFSKKEIIEAIIEDYASKFKQSKELHIKYKGRVPIQIDNALEHIRKYQIAKYQKTAYFIGSDNSPNDFSGTGNTNLDENEE